MDNVIPFRHQYDESFMIPAYSPYSFISQPESPETAIARLNPNIAADLLKDISRKVLDKNLADSAVEIGKTYLNCITDIKSPVLKESSGLGIKVLREFTQGKVNNFLFGTKEIGFSMTISLK